jgi:hypothetical protein
MFRSFKLIIYQSTYIETSDNLIRVWNREIVIVLQGAMIRGVLVLSLQVDQELHQVWL